MYRLLRKRYQAEFLAKAGEDRAIVVLLHRLQALYRQLSDEALRRILETAIERLQAAGNVDESVQAIQNLPLDELALAGAPKEAIATLEELAYRAGAQVIAPQFALTLPDYRALELIGQQNYFWIGSHYDEVVGQAINAVLREAIDQGWSRKRLGQALQDRFKALRDDEQDYYENLADHAVRKLRETGRTAGYQRAGIDYVKVKAILDRRTSRMCRCMHGRIIPVNRLQQQKESILAAQSKADLKAAQAWISEFHGNTSDLPKGVAAPPYHYRCRTVTVAYFPEVSDVGRKVQWETDTGKIMEDKIIFTHVDEKMGRELVLTDAGLEHVAQSKHAIPRTKIEAALRSIQQQGTNINLMALNGELVTLSQNGVVLVFRGNIIYTAFIPDRDPWKYFKGQVSAPLRKGEIDGPEGRDCFL